MRDVSVLNINEGGRPVRRPAPPRATIAAFERQYRLSLPTEFLALLRRANGGCPERGSFLPVGVPGASRHVVNRFHHLDEERDAPSSLWLAVERWRGVLGENALPFADDGCGNEYFLDLTKTPATVNECLHEEGFRKVLLAPSFEAFIDSLELDPDAI